MKKVIRLTESDLKNIVKKILQEQSPNLNPKNLKFGDRGNDVVILQQKLIDLGLLKVKNNKPTGYFGPLTRAALKAANEQKNPLNPPKIDTQFSQTSGNIPFKKDVSNKLKIKNVSNLGLNTASEMSKLNYFYDNQIPDRKLTTNPDSFLLYDGTYLNWMINGSSIKKWRAESGRTKYNAFTPGQKELVNKNLSKKEFSKIKDQGPIPEGNYTVGQLQERTGSSATDVISKAKSLWDLKKTQMKYEKKGHDWNTGTVVDKIAWGDFRAPITANSGTNTYGRGNFYIHGGGLPGSIGCIDLGGEMKDFARYYATWMATLGKNGIGLRVIYPS